MLMFDSIIIISSCKKISSKQQRNARRARKYLTSLSHRHRHKAAYVCARTPFTCKYSLRHWTNNTRLNTSIHRWECIILKQIHCARVFCVFYWLSVFMSYYNAFYFNYYVIILNNCIRFYLSKYAENSSVYLPPEIKYVFSGEWRLVWQISNIRLKVNSSKTAAVFLKEYLIICANIFIKINIK